MQTSTPSTQNPARQRRVAIDLFPIRVGEGGTGSGIWTYARELLFAMEDQIPEGLEMVCFVNEGQLPYLSELKNIRLIPFSGGTKKGILSRLIWMHFRLPCACRKHGVDVLHKLATENPWICPALRVTTVHDFYYEFLMEQRPSVSVRLYERLENVYFAWVTRICFKKSDAIIAVSEATRQEAVQRYPDAERLISVIHHGAPVFSDQRTGHRDQQPEIGEQTIATSSTTSINQPSADRETKGFTILCVAKFMEHKGQNQLIDAFNRMLDRHSELTGKVMLRLRGFHNDADYYERVCRKISDSGYSDAIRLESFHPGDGLEDIYRDADLVVLLSSYEGFGLPVLEAQGMGVPVLCSDLPVLREVGGSGAVYVNREDVDQVSEAIYRFVSDPSWFDEQQKRARENIHRFSWGDAACKTLEVYQITANSR